MDTDAVLRPRMAGDEEVNTPVEEAIIPNRILDDSDTLDLVMKIKNQTLKSAVLKSQIIDDNLAKDIGQYLKNRNSFTLKIGMLVHLKFELTKPLPRRSYRIIEVNFFKLFYFSSYYIILYYFRSVKIL